MQQLPAQEIAQLARDLGLATAGSPEDHAIRALISATLD